MIQSQSQIGAVVVLKQFCRPTLFLSVWILSLSIDWFLRCKPMLLF